MNTKTNQPTAVAEKLGAYEFLKALREAGLNDKLTLSFFEPVRQYESARENLVKSYESVARSAAREVASINSGYSHSSYGALGSAADDVVREAAILETLRNLLNANVYTLACLLGVEELPENLNWTLYV